MVTIHYVKNILQIFTKIFWKMAGSGIYCPNSLHVSDMYLDDSH